LTAARAAPWPQRAQTQKHHRLLGGGKAAGGPFPTATGLSLTEFFFPLLQPMLRMVGQPTIRQQNLQGSRGGATYTGGTNVTAGTLVITNNTALADGTSLTVGADTILIFDGLTAGSLVTSSTSTVAVPEPSTSALLGIGAIGLIGWAWRKRRQRQRLKESEQGSSKTAQTGTMVEENQALAHFAASNNPIQTR